MKELEKQVLAILRGSIWKTTEEIQSEYNNIHRNPIRVLDCLHIIRSFIASGLAQERPRTPYRTEFSITPEGYHVLQQGGQDSAERSQIT